MIKNCIKKTLVTIILGFSISSALGQTRIIIDVENDKTNVQIVKNVNNHKLLKSDIKTQEQTESINKYFEVWNNENYKQQQLMEERYRKVGGPSFMDIIIRLFFIVVFFSFLYLFNQNI